MIRCVAFDFDGTLADSNEIKRQAFFDVVGDHDPDGSTVADVVDRIRPGDRYAVAREIARLLRERGCLGASEDADTWSQHWADAYTKACESAVAQCPEIAGASEALAWLERRGIPSYVNSATPAEPLRRVLELRGMDRRFAGIYGGPVDKPDNLRKILADVACVPDGLLFVGDGEDDRVAAETVGCLFVGVTRPGSDRFAKEVTPRIADLTTLPAIVSGVGANLT
jgi:phosphoglycolate phosphatase-like HAD superfamily hydrolase